MKFTRRQLQQIIREAISFNLHERRMATDVYRIVARALNKRPMTHQELLAHVLAVHPNVSDEEIDMHIDNLEDTGAIIYNNKTGQYV